MILKKVYLPVFCKVGPHFHDHDADGPILLCVVVLRGAYDSKRRYLPVFCEVGPHFHDHDADGPILLCVVVLRGAYDVDAAEGRAEDEVKLYGVVAAVPLGEAVSGGVVEGELVDRHVPLRHQVREEDSRRDHGNICKELKHSTKY